MMDEMKELLTNAMHEIRNLRRQNELLGAKVEVMDFFATVLHTTPAHHNQGESLDVAWLLQKKLDELTESSMIRR